MNYGTTGQTELVSHKEEIYNLDFREVFVNNKILKTSSSPLGFG
jgi:hypothetical protein